MNWTAISRNVGTALLVSALFMLLSVGVSVLNGNDSALAALIISFTITFVVGIFPFIFVRRTSEINLKEGFVIITLSWLLSFVFGMLPYALWGGPFSLQNAWFESVSGFTTTGATILDDIESIPASLLFWRSSTHFIGGLGVVVFLLLVIPGANQVKMRLTNMELSSLSRSGYNSRVGKTVYIFAYVYLGICVLAFFCFWAAGMPPFDSICHAMSVCACGGFSTRNLSIAAFDSRLIELVSIIFMTVSSIHFGLIFLAIASRSLKPLNNQVLKFYLASLLVSTVVIASSVFFRGSVRNPLEALWQSLFQTVSIASTTGFAITDNAGWPVPTTFLFLALAVMCGCAGSTTGGVKADRVLVLFKALGRQIAKILHPSSVGDIKMGGKVIRDEAIFPQILYLVLYVTVLSFSVLLCLSSGVDLHNSVFASVSCLSNVGPAVGDLGWMGSFNSVPEPGKLVFTMDMFLGRLEIYPVLAVVAMMFDRNRS